ncbi:type II toxin-antitoxin system VapC family toxin [Desulfobacterales bacterium HSG17]|nr:type II toxin-antitoxin system VapC family toxin [Desulfobacterales bacterium HSG17]
MESAYFDTSALVKRYVEETGSQWVNALLISLRTLTIFTSQLTVVETTCAFSRRMREGTLSSKDYEKLMTAFGYDTTYRYIVADVMHITIETACELSGRHPLRAYDAVHLATAILINREMIRNSRQSLTFICADNRLLNIAQAENLHTENPNDHSSGSN